MRGGRDFSPPSRHVEPQSPPGLPRHACDSFLAAMKFEIRPAKPDDCDIILSLIRELAEYEKLAHEVETTAEKLRATLFVDPPAAHCVLAFADGQPAGFALYFFNYSTFLAKRGLYLEDLFVKPAHRGAGLGKALLLHLARIANARGCGRMEWSVLDWNEPAIGFYKKLGAVPMAEWTVFRLTGPTLRQYA
jgi:GNAT superfamily N-acetyltransferase